MTLLSLLLGCVLFAVDDEVPLAARFVVAREVAFVGEPIEVSLRLEWDERWFAARALQPFLQPLDLPLEAEVAALSIRPDALARPGRWRTASSKAASSSRTLVMNGERIAVELAGAPDAEGRVAVELARTFLPTQAGRFVLPAATLRFATASRFDVDLLGSRIALDRQERTLVVDARVIEVIEPPAEGRPAAFAGAIGRFRVTASATSLDVEAGATLRCTVRVEGEGNFERIAAPRFEATGFALLGTLARVSESGVEFHYDVAAAQPGAWRLPAFELVALDPGPPATYVELATDAIPVTVRATAASEAAAAAATEAAKLRDQARAELALLAPLRAVERGEGLYSSVVERTDLGLRACRDGDFAAAEQWFRAALAEADTAAPALRFNLGHARFARGDVVGALCEWLQAAPALAGDSGLDANVALAAARLDLPAPTRERLAARVRDGGVGRGSQALVVTPTALLAEPTAKAATAAQGNLLPPGTLLTLLAQGVRYVEVSDGAARGFVPRAAITLLDPSRE